MYYIIDDNKSYNFVTLSYCGIAMAEIIVIRSFNKMIRVHTSLTLRTSPSAGLINLGTPSLALTSPTYKVSDVSPL